MSFLFLQGTEKKIWSSIVCGWLFVFLAGAVSYVTSSSSCGWLTRLNVGESGWGMGFLAVAFIFLGYGVVTAYQTTGFEGVKKSWWAILVTVIVLAFVAVPFNTHDFSFYFSAARAAHVGVPLYTANWVSENVFTCPAVTGVGTGIMYGPLAVSFFKGLFSISQGSVVIFMVAWKLFMVAGLLGALYAMHQFLRSVQPGISNKTLILILLAQPLIVWEWVANGHFDGLWVTCVMISLWCAQKRRWWLVVPFLVIGAWIKLVPILLVPWFALWWWQGLSKKTWLREVMSVLIGMVLGSLVTVAAWAPYWQGLVVFKPIILQTKWAVNSLFAAVYYTFRPVANSLFGEQAHWLLTRLVHAGVLLLAIYLLSPLIREVWLIVRKKKQATPEWFVTAIFVSLTVYLSIWQKSFWPWYISWLLPLGLVAYGFGKSPVLKKILLWLGTAPLVFYLVLIANRFIRQTDAASETWFYWVVVGLVWVAPLLWLWQWRREAYVFDAKGVGKDPVLFGLRQLYRVGLVYPYWLVLKFFYKAGFLKVTNRNQEKVKDCFLVTSVIYPRLDKNVSYGSIRSPFSPVERAEHTRKTIESIRRAVPHAKIVLIESGLRSDLPGGLIDMVDQYLYLGNVRLVRWACDSKVKSFGEVMMLLVASKKLVYYSQRYFKLSGRYFLTSEFDLSAWEHDAFMFRYLQVDYVSTRLYGFSQAKFVAWRYALLKGLPFNMIDYAIENTLAKTVPANEVVKQSQLGLQGIGAGNSQVISE